jgi:hypothetical protein
MDDEAMIRVYARENATQRGSTSTALAGTVASAARILAKMAFTDTLPPTLEISRVEIEKHGIGWATICKFLPDIHGINSGSVQQQLANLKASGNYARLIAEMA